MVLVPQLRASGASGLLWQHLQLRRLLFCDMNEPKDARSLLGLHPTDIQLASRLDDHAGNRTPQFHAGRDGLDLRLRGVCEDDGFAGYPLESTQSGGRLLDRRCKAAPFISFCVDVELNPSYWGQPKLRGDKVGSRLLATHQCGE